MKKITTGSNVTVIHNNKPHMFMCGQDNNQYLFNFLTQCEDEEKIKEVLSNPSLETYIKTYDDFPKPNTIIFDHGHKVEYLACNSRFETKFLSEGEQQKIELCTFRTLKKGVNSFLADTRDEAISMFINNNSTDPTQLVTVCARCSLVHSIENLLTNKVISISNEVIKNV